MEKILILILLILAVTPTVGGMPNLPEEVEKFNRTSHSNDESTSWFNPLYLLGIPFMIIVIWILKVTIINYMGF